MLFQVFQGLREVVSTAVLSECVICNVLVSVDSVWQTRFVSVNDIHWMIEIADTENLVDGREITSRSIKQLDATVR